MPAWLVLRLCKRPPDSNAFSSSLSTIAGTSTHSRMRPSPRLATGGPSQGPVGIPSACLYLHHHHMQGISPPDYCPAVLRPPTGSFDIGMLYDFVTEYESQLGCRIYPQPFFPFHKLIASMHIHIHILILFFSTRPSNIVYSP